MDGDIEEDQIVGVVPDFVQSGPTIPCRFHGIMLADQQCLDLFEQIRFVVDNEDVHRCPSLMATDEAGGRPELEEMRVIAVPLSA